MKGLIFLGVIVFLIFHFTQSEEWTGFAYPNKNNLTTHIKVGEFETLQHCRDATLKYLSSLNAIYKGDYKCGLNCEFKPEWQTNVCEETKK